MQPKRTGTILGYDTDTGEPLIEIGADCCGGSAVCRPGDLPPELPFEQPTVGRKVAFEIDCAAPGIEAMYQGKLTCYPLARNIRAVGA